MAVLSTRARGARAFVEATRESIQVLQEVLSAHNQGLVHDALRTAKLAREVALHMGLGEDAAVRIELAARLHDIGKIGIPDEILRKPGALTAKEWELMRTHTEIGARIIGAAPALRDVAELVRCHHERHDGSGYPDGLRGDRIPIGASILGVCDSFVAMMRNRPFIDGITVVEALAELRRCSGTQFHPRVVEAFAEVFNEMFG
ncbi:MAG TPA: HD domain-containing phosphohydrolase [Solirubrobacteraceae bacterium]|jgi:response regulator RpfG family c-di-GMP phosphodiesterase|nr:HD domain-containing phosphohydrolase [Solirubrobacteraceae bacterium]